MQRLDIGVVGVGHLGSLHAKMYSQLGNANLVGIFDVDVQKARQVAQEIGTKAFETVDEVIEASDAVSVVTTTTAHYETAKKALEHGVHTFIEKPITETIDQARTLISIAEANNLKIQVGHIERFNPAILALESYNLKPLFIESHRLAQFSPRGSDVAVVLDLMIHDIDLILSLVKSPVARIDANGVAVVSDTADIANARIQFQNGCVANVTASRISQQKMRKMRLFQQDAYISIDFAQGLAEVFRLIDEGDANAKPTMLLGKIDQGTKKRAIIYEQPEVKEVNALKHELDLFVQAILNDSDPAVNGNDGMQALEVAREIVQRIEAQKVKIG